MLFQEDIKKTIGIFLISLIPLLLAEDYIIENLQIIFKINSNTAFWAFKWIYFSSPFIIIIVFAIFNKIKPKGTRDVFFKNINDLLAIYFIILLIISILSLNLRYESFIISNIIIIFLFILALLYLINKYNKTLKIKQKRGFNINNIRRNSLFQISCEFIIVVLLTVSIFLVYYVSNRSLADKYNCELASNQKSLHLEKDSIVNILNSESTKIYIEQGIIENAPELKLDGMGVFQFFKYSSELRENTKILNKKWSSYLKYVIFNGVLILFLGLFPLHILYYTLLYYWTQNGLLPTTIENDNPNQSKKQANEFESYLKSIRTTLLLIVILIAPAYYSTNFDKDIYSSPFLNFTNKDPHIFDVSLSLPIDDKSIKYLEAIWLEQTYYQNRFYNPYPDENVIRWNNTLDTNKNIREIIDKPPIIRNDSINEILKETILKNLSK